MSAQRTEKFEPLSQMKKQSGMCWKQFFDCLENNTLPDRRGALSKLIQE